MTEIRISHTHRVYAYINDTVHLLTMLKDVAMLKKQIQRNDCHTPKFSAAPDPPSRNMF